MESSFHVCRWYTGVPLEAKRQRRWANKHR